MDMGDTLEARVNRLKCIHWGRQVYLASLALSVDPRKLCHCLGCLRDRANQQEHVVPTEPGEWGDGPPRRDPPPDLGSYV